MGLGVIVTAAAVLYFHSAFGWFANNKNVTGDGMQANVKDPSLFELAVRDRNPGTPADDQRSPYSSSSPIVEYLGEGTNGGYEKLNITDNGHPNILCHFVNENPHEADSEDLAPGAFGKISFDIVLTGEYRGDFEIKLEFLPLRESGSEIVQVVVGGSEEAQNRQRALLELLSGHILFFKNRGNLVNGGYLYSDMLTDDSFTFELPATPDHTEDGKEYYSVDIYWIWPSTFGQLALETDSEYVHARHVFEDSDERLSMQEYVKTNPDCFFYGLSSEQKTAVASYNAGDHGGLNYVEYYFTELSEGYNRGDQIIGDMTNYLVVCIDVEASENA